MTRLESRIARPQASFRPQRATDGATRRLKMFVRGHAGLTAALVAASLVRLIVILAYRPALYFNDTFEYVGVAYRHHPYLIRPNGYTWLLMLLEPFHSFTLVTVIQHALGLAVGILVYALLRHHGVRNSLASLAALPLLFDSGLIQLEHVVLSDTLFSFLLVAAVVLLLWKPEPRFGRLIAAGLLVAAAALTRAVGLPVGLLLIVLMAARRTEVRRLAAFTSALLVPLAIYAAWFGVTHGRLGITRADGIFLYARTTTFSRCEQMDPPLHLRYLCLDSEVNERPSPPVFVWNPGTPLYQLPGETFDNSVPSEFFSERSNSLGLEFALLAIRSQPWDYARTIFKDLVRTFGWARTTYPSSSMARGFRFTDEPWWIHNRTFVAGATAPEDMLRYEGRNATTKVHSPFWRWAAAYHGNVFVRGPLILLMIVMGFIGAVLRSEPHKSWSLIFLLLVGLTVLIVPIMTITYDARYVLPSLPFFTCAAAWSLELLVKRIERARNPIDLRH